MYLRNRQGERKEKALAHTDSRSHSWLDTSSCTQLGGRPEKLIQGTAKSTYLALAHNPHLPLDARQSTSHIHLLIQCPEIKKKDVVDLNQAHLAYSTQGRIKTIMST